MINQFTPNVDQNEVLTAIVKRFLQVDDITIGTTRDRYIARYRGRLYNEDTAAAYDELAERLRPMDIMPLFRWDGKRHMIVLVQGMPRPRPSNSWVNLFLGIATLLSVFITGGLSEMDQPLPNDVVSLVLTLFWRGLPYGLSLMAILAAHEFGHYLAGRHHGVQLTLPYFIPLPLISPFGTMGAFINMKEIPKNRRVLMDIGLAGPLAGLVVALPVLLIGLYLSKINIIPTVIPEGMLYQLEGNSLIYLLSKLIVFGQLLPVPAGGYSNISALLYWIRYFFTGQPLPLGGLDVMLHPMAFAGWAGLLVTAMNLIPVGQLDGGHMLYVLIGRKWATRILPVILVALVALGFVWSGWWLWAVLIFLLGRTYAEPLDQITPLDNRRKALAVLALVIFILTFIPVPLNFF